MKIENKMVHMQCQNFSWIETQIFQEALVILKNSRHTLMYTYVFAYYLEQNNMSKIFEDNQSNLEIYTEQLSELLEFNFNNENLPLLKQKVCFFL